MESDHIAQWVNQEEPWSANVVMHQPSNTQDTANIIEKAVMLPVHNNPDPPANTHPSFWEVAMVRASQAGSLRGESLASARLDKRFRYGRNLSTRSVGQPSRATSLRPVSQLPSALYSQFSESGRQSKGSTVYSASIRSEHQNTLLKAASEGSAQPSMFDVAKMKHSELL
jgi:hypothetical protein